MVMGNQYACQFQIVVMADFEYDVAITRVNDMAETSVGTGQQPDIIIIKGRKAVYVDHGCLMCLESGITGILSICQLAIQ